MVLPVSHGAQQRIVEISVQRRSVPVPLRWIGAAIETTVSLAIFAFLAMRRPSLGTAALVWYGCGLVYGNPIIGMFGWLPDPAFAIFGLTFLIATTDFPVFALLLFITRFPKVPTGGAAIVRRRVGDAIVAVAAVACVAVFVLEPIPFFWDTAHVALDLAATIAVLAFTVAAYASAIGEERQRIGWVLVGVVISEMAYFIAQFFNVMLPIPESDLIQAWLSLPGIALPIALAYAIVRHRVLDLGFALNRAAVFTATTAVVVGVFSALQWSANTLLVGMTRVHTFAIQLVIAIIVFFVVRAARTRTEHMISQVFFAKRRQRIDTILRLIGELDTVIDVSELPALVGDRLRVVEIEATLAFLGEGELPAGAVPFEIKVRGHTQGRLLCVPPINEGDFAPDESAVLTELAKSIGIVREELAAERLQREVTQLRVEIAGLRAATPS